MNNQSLIKLLQIISLRQDLTCCLVYIFHSHVTYPPPQMSIFKTRQKIQLLITKISMFSPTCKNVTTQSSFPYSISSPLKTIRETETRKSQPLDGTFLIALKSEYYWWITSSVGQWSQELGSFLSLAYMYWTPY